MHTIESKYLGELRTENIHIQSGQKIITDAPVDNKGKGEAFSPTDLVAAAVCDCILTIAGIAGNQHGFSIDGASAKTTKKMTTCGPRRIDEITVEIDLSKSILNKKHQAIIKKIPEYCPVALSLHPEIKQNISFKF